MSKKKSCVIVIENLPAPLDRRVWQEANVLKSAGWDVSIICPATEKYPARRETLNGIEIYRHWLPLEARGKLGFVLEYSVALFCELMLLARIKLTRGFSVIQACNPPDIIFLAAAPFVLAGDSFVFDQHDPCPELFSVKYGQKGLLHRLLVTCERLTYRMASVVVTANHSFKELAVGRGGVEADKVVPVYSVPDRSRMRRVEPDRRLREGRAYVIGYLGIIGDQDGLDHLVEMTAALKRMRPQKDFMTVIVGDGPALASVKAMATRLGVDDVIRFTGYLSGEALLSQISDFDVGVIPDPVNESNDIMSMNKVFEYSAISLPIVTYALKETRRLIGDAAFYAETPDPQGLAEATMRALDHDDERRDYARRAKEVSDRDFIWENEARKYLAAMEAALNRDRPLARLNGDGWGVPELPPASPRSTP